MKKPDFIKPGAAGLSILILAVLLLFSSCEQGIFNFNEETGNLSLSFSAESAETKLGKITVSLSNDESGANIEEESSIDEYGSTQEAELYFSRIDTGNWSIHIKIIDSGGTVVSERDDSFELGLGETVIAEIEYYSGGAIDLFYEKPSGSQPDSLIVIDTLDTLINVAHYGNDPLDNADTGAYMIAQGSGFDSFLTGLRAEYPDGGYFDYGGGWSRAVSGIEVDVQPASISVSRSAYATCGNYSLSVTDLNGTEVSETDDCWFDFPAETGFVSFTGDPYDGGVEITATMHEFNDVQAGKSVFAYIVDQSNGTFVSEANIVVEDPGLIDPATFSFFLNTAMAAGWGDCWVVIVSTDLDYGTATDAANGINYHFQNEGPNLLPDRLPEWLYIHYGDQLNYIGISIVSWFF